MQASQKSLICTSTSSFASVVEPNTNREYNTVIDLRSVWRGIRAMTHDRGAVNVSISLGKFGWWIDLWTPIWHEGRGPYISCGLGMIRILRGY